MKHLLQTLFGRTTIYLLAISMTFLPLSISSGIAKVYAAEDSYEKAEKELEGVMEESKAAISGEKKAVAPLIDEEPPMIMHAPVQTAGKKDIQIQATIEDATEVKEAKLYYRVKGNESFENVKMKEVEGGMYVGVIPADKVSFAGMEYYIEASDSNNNTATDGSKEIVYPILVEGTPPVEQNLKSAAKPIYKKWWFWTLAAVVAGGAAALGGASGGGGGGGNPSGGNSGSGGGSGSGGTGTVTGTW